MKRVLLAILSVSALSACSPQMDDLVAYTEEVKQRVPSTIEPYPEFEPQPVFVYSAQDLRSPFNPTEKASAPVQAQVQTNCLQPDFARSKQPLEQYGIDALKLTGNFTTNGVRWVLFSTNDGALHKATQGSRLGLFFGKIIAISDSSVTIEELLPDGAGCWQRQEVVLSLDTRGGENNNV
ncbi:pilus assembly protein PilP [Alteromonas sediminis]|uniref:Pilus assembly protein PilP n=2 Tax=Alteromonas sediminis TaxID=2259342 RepID=A0A3N5Y1G4_9ALTE|nr:pilus assembly protein PilP [Alteromonas sediminis]RPJ66813.1 pilus assembly protein PilP [Alteromonas sediminis]